MFFDVYKRLCAEQGKDPYSVPLKVGYKSNSVVAQWAAGSVPRGKYLNSLAEFFDVTVPYLLDMGENEKSAAKTDSGLHVETAYDLLNPQNKEKIRIQIVSLLKQQSGS